MAQSLEARITRLEGQMIDSQAETLKVYLRIEELFAKIEGRLATIEADVGTLKTDVATLKTDVATLKTDVATLKTDVATLKTDLAALDKYVREDLTERVDQRSDALDKLTRAFQEHVLEVHPGPLR
ncbi:MAG: hypothetical protein OXS29_10490 [bacterium]|nr:hypothetical protein [bacterium]